MQTAAVTDYAAHPLSFYFQLRLRVTINTDNRLVTDTTVSKELLLCHQHSASTSTTSGDRGLRLQERVLPYREKGRPLARDTKELDAIQLPDAGRQESRPVELSRRRTRGELAEDRAKPV